MRRRKGSAGRLRITMGFVLLAAVVFFACGSGAAASGIKIVSLDMQRVFNSHPAFHEAMDRFQAEIQDMQKRISEMDEDQQAAAQQMMQHQMQNLGMQLQEEAFGKIQADIKKIADEKGYDYVIDSSMLIVGGHDITEEVIESFEKMSVDEGTPAE